MLRGVGYSKEFAADVKKDDTAVILHSGGTTGKPKHIVLSNGNLNVVCYQARISMPKFNGDIDAWNALNNCSTQAEYDELIKKLRK